MKPVLFTKSSCRVMIFTVILSLGGVFLFSPASLSQSTPNRDSGKCSQSEQESYEKAVEALSKVRAKGQAALYNCSGIGASWQKIAPKQCCDNYFATRNKPGMWDEAWYILQKCAWKEEIKSRKAALEKKIEACGKKLPSEPVPAVSGKGVSVAEIVRRVLESIPPLETAIQEVLGKKAFLVVSEEPGGFTVINNRGKRGKIPAKLADHFQVSNTPAILSADVEKMINPFLTQAPPPIFPPEIFPPQKEFRRKIDVSTYFSEDEFVGGSTVKALWEAIEKDGYRISHPPKQP